MVCDVGRCVGCASYSHLLPGQEENDSPITGSGVEKSHVLWAEVKRKVFLKLAKNLIYNPFHLPMLI